ncbi:MAG: hypothetical protein QMB14_03060 [Polaromonas sp.]
MDKNNTALALQVIALQLIWYFIGFEGLSPAEHDPNHTSFSPPCVEQIQSFRLGCWIGLIDKRQRNELDRQDS